MAKFFVKARKTGPYTVSEIDANTRENALDRSEILPGRARRSKSWKYPRYHSSLGLPYEVEPMR